MRLGPCNQSQKVVDDDRRQDLFRTGLEKIRDQVGLSPGAGLHIIPNLAACLESLHAGAIFSQMMEHGKPRMDFVDRALKCAECGSEFVFTAGEQLFFHEKQFKNDPKRCKACKAKGSSGSRGGRPETRTVCSVCGMETTVPFKPTQGRPVLCRQCFQQKRTASPVSAPTVAN
jgi:CxxC-x17-CxxC domain-containing protein